MKRFPKISIVTPSYNQAQYLEETILSLIRQNYPNLEYIIIDGGSTDQTLDIIKKYEQHVTFWISEKDRGQTHAINKGLKYCTGDVFNWLNSDDILTQGALYKIGQVFMAQQPFVFCGRVSRIDEKGAKLSEGSHTYVGDSLAQTAGFYSIAQPGMFYATKILSHLIPLSEVLHYSMDLELWVRYLLSFKDSFEKIITSDTEIASFRLQNASKTIVEQQSQSRKVSGFTIDDCTIFYRVAEYLGEEKYLKLLKQQCGEIRSNYKLQLCMQWDVLQPLLRSILQFFVLRKAKDAFYQNDSYLFGDLMNEVDWRFLSPQGIRDYRYLRRQLFISRLKKLIIPE